MESEKRKLLTAGPPGAQQGEQKVGIKQGADETGQPAGRGQQASLREHELSQLAVAKTDRQE